MVGCRVEPKPNLGIAKPPSLLRLVTSDYFPSWPKYPRVLLFFAFFGKIKLKLLTAAVPQEKSCRVFQSQLNNH